MVDELYETVDGEEFLGTPWPTTYGRDAYGQDKAITQAKVSGLVCRDQALLSFPFHIQVYSGTVNIWLPDYAQGNYLYVKGQANFSFGVGAPSGYISLVDVATSGSSNIVLWSGATLKDWPTPIKFGPIPSGWCSTYREFKWRIGVSGSATPVISVETPRLNAWFSDT